MLRKTLLLTAVFCLLAAPAAMAGVRSCTRQAVSAGWQSPGYGLCVKGTGAGAEVIPWANSETQCRYSTNGTRWIENGITRSTFNLDRTR